MDVSLPSPAEIELAPPLLKLCIWCNKTMQETMDILFANLKIPPPYTRIVWDRLESEIPGVFQAYYARMNSLFPNHNHNNNPEIYNSVDYMSQIQQLQWVEFLTQVEASIKYSMEINRTKQEIIISIHTILKMLPAFTEAVWEVLEERNPQLFQAYYARLEMIHQNGAENGMHHQNGGELVAPDAAENGIHHQNGGELVAPDAAENGIHHQNGGELVAPDAAENGIHHQNGGELVAPNAAQNGIHHQNDVEQQNQQPQVYNGNGVDHQQVNGHI